MATKINTRQSLNTLALPAIGTAANTDLDIILSAINTVLGDATSAPTPSTIMSRDANANTQINNIIQNETSTATAAGTTTLTVASSYFQQFTGTTTQTVVLPDATALKLGQAFYITNRSTGNVTVNANGGGLIQVLGANTQAIVTVTNIGTSAGTWDVSYTISTALSNPMTTLGDTIYGAAGGVPTDLPGNTTTTNQFLTQTGTGSASAAPVWATIQNSDLPAKNISISASTGLFVNGTSSYVSAGISAGLLTTGRPVMVQLIPDGSANNSELVCDPTGTAEIYLVRNSTNIAQFLLNTPSFAYLPGNFLTIDVVPAGSYTYQLFSTNIAADLRIDYIKIVAWEM